MSNKQLRIPFNSPLHPQDTEFSTYGCRQNNPDICGNNGLPGVCAFASDDCICKNYLAHGRSSSKSSKNQAAKLSFTALLTLISGESHFKGTATVHRSLKYKGEQR